MVSACSTESIHMSRAHILWIYTPHPLLLPPLTHTLSIHHNLDSPLSAASPMKAHSFPVEFLDEYKQQIQRGAMVITSCKKRYKHHHLPQVVPPIRLDLTERGWVVCCQSRHVHRSPPSLPSAEIRLLCVKDLPWVTGCIIRIVCGLLI